MSGPTQATGASREERMEAILATLEEGIATILTSEGYREYLAVMSRFHGYSFNNVMLIMLQRPDATRVAGFHTWRRMGRRVKRGETGIRIMVPYRTKVLREDDESDPLYVLRGFGIGVVFDLSQTEGTPLPEGPVVREPEGEHAEAAQMMTALTRHVVGRGVTIVREETRGHRGYWHPGRREIGIRRDLVGISATKTLCHEVAHFLADHRGNVAREDAESVAESAAYVALMHRGIDVGEYSFGYIAGWAQDLAVFRRNLGEVQKISDQLIGIVDDAQPVSDEGSESTA